MSFYCVVRDYEHYWAGPQGREKLNPRKKQTILLAMYYASTPENQEKESGGRQRCDGKKKLLTWVEEGFKGWHGRSTQTWQNRTGGEKRK